VLVVYGREKPLQELDRRAAGAGGDRAHLDAVRRQEELERTEHAVDEARPSDAA
jgi:hypothetical protein